MSIPRVFVSYYTSDKTQRDQQFATRLIDDLRVAGADVATDGNSITDESFVQTINQELPNRQWFIFIENPEALQSPRIQMTVNTALNLVAQRRMQGALRVIASSSNPQEVPPTWTRLRTFDASHNYAGALAQLLVTLGLQAGKVQTIPSHTHLNSQAANSYDRPITPPVRPSFLRSWKGGALVGLVALVLLLLIGSLLGPTILASRTPTIVNSQLFGYAHFTSTGFLNATNSQGIDDGIQVDLSHLTTPAPSKSYYAWLLPDKGQIDANALLLGKLPVQRGAVHFSYVDPSHTNLLRLKSRFLITEGSADFTPGTTSDRSTWRYYAEIPQIQNPDNTTSHLSLLELLRRLLVSDPQLLKVSLQGGLNIWLLQNTGKVLEWATAARGTGQQQNPQLMHRHFVRILDYLDGTQSVQSDVPSGTPILSDSQIAKVPLLTSDPGHQEPSGYVDDIGRYLHDLVRAPGITQNQRDRVMRITTALNNVKTNLEQVHQDAKKLVHMTDAQLLDPATVPLLDDMHGHANSAYAGQTDANMGTNQGGTLWIYDISQSLASLAIEKYAI